MQKASVILLGGFAAEAGGTPVPDSAWRLRKANVNFLGDAGEAESAYGEETYRRLVALKDEYDPTNLFRYNQNIPPSG